MASGLNKPYSPSNKDLLDEALEIRDLIKDGQPRGMDKKLNILVVGLPGSGKSSLINSLITAIDKGGHFDRAKTGFAGEGSAKGGSAVTPGLQKIQLFQHSPDPEEKEFGSRIALWDFAGLMDADESIVLESLVKGDYEHGKQLANMKGNWPSFWTSVIKPWWDTAELDERRMHLVICVQAAGVPAPENLLGALRKVTDPFESKRNVTLLVVITKMDTLENKEKMNEDDLAFRETDAVAKHLKSAGEANRTFAVSLYSRKTAFFKGRMRRVHSIDDQMCYIWKSILNPYYYENLS